MYRIRHVESFRAEVRDPDLVALVCSLIPALRGCERLSGNPPSL
jgi:hypothetical protein